MRLNHSCVRKVLLFIEAETQVYQDEHGRMKQIEISLHGLYDANCLQKYSKEDIWYTTLKLFEGRYIDGWKSDGGTLLVVAGITGLTLRGHDLVDNVREEPIWTNTKKVLAKAGSVSLSVMSQIAGAVAAEYTKNLIRGTL